MSRSAGLGTTSTRTPTDRSQRPGFSGRGTVSGMASGGASKRRRPATPPCRRGCGRRGQRSCSLWLIMSAHGRRTTRRLKRVCARGCRRQPPSTSRRQVAAFWIWSRNTVRGDRGCGRVSAARPSRLHLNTLLNWLASAAGHSQDQPSKNCSPPTPMVAGRSTGRFSGRWPKWLVRMMWPLSGGSCGPCTGLGWRRVRSRSREQSPPTLRPISR